MAGDLVLTVAMTTTRNQVNKIISRRRNGHGVLVWVGLGWPTEAQKAEDDYTCPEITHAYYSKRALLAAIETGEAFK